MMIRAVLMPVLALAGIGVAVLSVLSAGREVQPSPPLAEPPRSPFADRIAASGVIEAESENLAIGASLPGIVVEIGAREGDQVEAGQLLFRVDDREAAAALAQTEAALAVARAQLTSLEARPRAEEIPPSEARVKAAEARLADARARLTRVQGLADPGAVSAEERRTRVAGVTVAEADLDGARADLALLRAGTFAPEIDLARARVDAARADVRAARTLLERLAVRAPIAGTVLARNVRLGEYAPANAVQPPLFVLGATRVLHVRADIDENDCWRFVGGAPARFSLRGNSDLGAPLRFVRVDPLVVPKRSLSGSGSERVDTRVLQVLFAFDPGELPVYVGQQVDVFIDAPNGGSEEAPRAPSAGR